MLCLATVDSQRATLHQNSRVAKGRDRVRSSALVKVTADDSVRRGVAAVGLLLGSCGLSLSAQLAVWVQTFGFGGVQIW